MIEEAIRTRLTSYAGVTALASTRTYPLVLPQGVTLPAIRYQKIDAEREHMMGSDSGVVGALFQVDSYAADPLAAKNLAAQVKAALSRYRDTVGDVVIQDVLLEGESEHFEDKVRMYRERQDYLVFYLE